MVTPSSRLVLIHDTLMAAVVPTLAPLVTAPLQFLADAVELVPPATARIARVYFVPPRRTLLASEGDPLIQQTGRFDVEWLFPREDGWNDIRICLEATKLALRERTLPGDIRLHGDAIANRDQDQQGRTVYHVSTEWETTAQEFSAAELRMQTNPVTEQEAMRAVRDVWADRVELAIAPESWPGLVTSWDVMPKTVLPLPFAAYFIGIVDSFGAEVDGPTQLVIGRALVQLHTKPSDGAVPTLHKLERVLAEHNRLTRQVQIGPVNIEGQSISPAATLQTNLRIPFSFERLRP
jgi:hypothetical protein